MGNPPANVKVIVDRGRPELMSDPIHPNSEGYVIVAERFSQAIRPYL
jgi:lysophospholipase L1-like esterase